MFRPVTRMAASKILDIQQIVEEYAWRFFEDLESTKGRGRSENKGLEKGDVNFDVNLKLLAIRHEEPEYCHLEPTSPKPYTLFKTIFTNNTDRSQEYSFKTERSTESVCLICREQGFNIGEQAELTLKTPCEIMEFKAGFKHEMSVNDIKENSISETLTWGVDSVISVPPRYQTVAELVVEEMKYGGTFNVQSILSGRVIVSLIRRRDGYLIMPISTSIVEVFKDFLDNAKGPANREIKNMVAIDKHFVRIISRGKCSYEFAMKQKVVLNEEGTRKEADTQTDEDTFMD